MKQWLIAASEWQLAVAEPGGELRRIVSADMLECRIEEAETLLKLVWRGHPEAGGDFTVEVTWRPGEPAGIWDGEFAYRGYRDARFVEEIRFPTLRAPVSAATRLLFGGWDMGMNFGPGEFPGPGEEFTMPIHGLPLAALSVGDGVRQYLDFIDPRFYVKGQHCEVSADGATFTTRGVWYPPLGATPAEAEAIPYRSGCGQLAGDWFQVGRTYKTRLGPRPRRAAPNPLRDIGLWVWNRGAIAAAIPPVERLQQALPEVPVALDWYWWHHNPYDTDYPDFWPPREGEEAFTAAVARLRRQGIYCQVYTNGVCWDMDGATWQEGGAADVIVKRDGEPFAAEFNCYNHHRLAFMCGEAPHYQRRMVELVGRLRAAGLSGHYLDMIGCATGYCCFNPAHRHPRNGGVHMVAGYREYLGELRRRYPDFPLTTESCGEPFMDLFSGSIICNSTSGEHLGIKQEMVPLFTAVHHGGYAFFGSYAHFDGIPPWDELWPAEDRWQGEEPWHELYPDQYFIEFARPVVWGAQPMVCKITDDFFDAPEFAAHREFAFAGARLYFANREFLFDGEMLDPAGMECAETEVEFLARMIFTTRDRAEVITRRLPAVLHSAWRSPAGKEALFVVNYTANRQAWQWRGRHGVLEARSWQKIELN